MTYKLFLTALLFLAAFSSCKEKSDSIYAGCCGAEPTEDDILVAAPDYDNNGNFLDSIVEAHIYIPNIFVPNIDAISGLNETFKFFSGKGVYMVTEAVYSDENGDVFYQKENFLPDNGNFYDGWDGRKPDGNFHFGKFSYRISITFLDSQVKTYIGEACSFKCGDDGFPASNVPGCFFPSQHNGNGQLDKTLYGSNDCF